MRRAGLDSDTKIAPWCLIGLWVFGPPNTFCAARLHSPLQALAFTLDPKQSNTRECVRSCCGLSILHHAAGTLFADHLQIQR